MKALKAEPFYFTDSEAYGCFAVGRKSEEETLIYNYTCGETDYIKMCTLPSPKLDLRDLQAEKKLLEKEEEYC